MPMLETRALTKQYPGVAALDALDLELEPGIIGLVGANGAGKSTLIKILLGLLDADQRRGARCSATTSRTQGTAAAPVRRLHARARLPAARRQRHRLRRPHGADQRPARAPPRASAPPRCCATSACSRSATAQIGGYSTGMKQRVKLAQALVHDPRLLLLDEPTNGLDPAGRDEMLDLIRRIGTRVRHLDRHVVPPARRDRARLRLPRRHRRRPAACAPTPIASFTGDDAGARGRGRRRRRTSSARCLSERGLTVDARRPQLLHRSIDGDAALRPRPRRRRRARASACCAWSSAATASKTCSAPTTTEAADV